MSIAYNLDVAAPDLTPEDLLVRVFQSLGLSAEAEARRHTPRTPGKDTIEADGPGFRAFASLVEEPARTFMTEDYGITPTVQISFLWNKTGSPSDVGRLILSATAALLRQLPCDLMLHHDTGLVYLLRRQEKLTVNTKAVEPYGLAQIPEPYEQGEIGES